MKVEVCSVFVGMAMLFVGCAPDIQPLLPSATGVAMPDPIPEAAPVPPNTRPVAVPAIQGQTITLEEVFTLVRQNNPTLAAASREVSIGESRAVQAGLLPNPELEVGLDDFGGSTDRSGLRGSEATLALSQKLELGGKREGRVRVAQFGTALAAWRIERTRLDVLALANTAFVQVLAAQHRVELTKEKFLLSGQVLDVVGERVEAGRTSPLEERRAEVLLANAQIELDRRLRELDGARFKLASSWASERPTFERVTGSFETIMPTPGLEKLRADIENNPDIARWNIEESIRRGELALARAGAIPDLEVSAGVTRFNENDENAFQLGFTLPLPLFDRNQGGKSEALARVAQVGDLERAAVNETRRALDGAYQALQTAEFEIVNLRTGVIAPASETFDAMREGFRQGRFSLLDVLDAQRTLFDAQGDLIDALETHHLARVTIDRLTGAHSVLHATQ